MCVNFSEGGIFLENIHPDIRIEFCFSASIYLREKGPTLVTELTTQFAGEIIGLIDQYATRVNSKIKQEVSIFWRSLFRRSSAFFKVNKKIRSPTEGQGPLLGQ